MQEHCEETETGVRIRKLPAPGANIRRRGQDLEEGQNVLSAGHRLRPQDLGLVASLGMDQVSVYRRLRVAVLSTGDELVEPGEQLGPGQIYNSNRFLMVGQLSAWGFEVVDLGVAPDRPDAIRKVMMAAADQSDVILTSGGVSVGEEDHVKPAVEALGSLDMWKIAIRPGKPVAFGHVDGTPFIGSPGNPVSLFVTFLLFVRPFLLRMQGREDWRVVAMQAKADFDWPRPDKRREFHRARLAYDEAGVARLSVHPSRSSGVLSSVTWANGLAVIPEGRVLKPGDELTFLPFNELLT
jgi:molybdopterin molybdotransferase